MTIKCQISETQVCRASQDIDITENPCAIASSTWQMVIEWYEAKNLFHGNSTHGTDEHAAIKTIEIQTFSSNAGWCITARLLNTFRARSLHQQRTTHCDPGFLRPGCTRKRPQGASCSVEMWHPSKPGHSMIDCKWGQKKSWYNICEWSVALMPCTYSQIEDLCSRRVN